MVSSTSPATVRSKAGAIFRVTSGNFLEQFDFLHRPHVLPGKQ